MTTALVMLNCFVLVGFGIVDQNDMYKLIPPFQSVKF